jgi:hypothetical protein
MAFGWEEIRGFYTPDEYQKFCDYIESQIAQGVVEEKSPRASYHKGLIFGGRWFEDVQTKQTWRLVAPDFPFKGLWEKVDLDLPKNG